MPRDLFILGCGRSGTSMVAGLFRSAGYFQGTALHEPRPSNPLGFFEDAEVNDINEALLGPLLPDRRFEGVIEYLADAPGRGQKWLARIPLDREILSTPTDDDRIAAVLSNRPFCLKDPRFCYTLHLWRKHAPNARMICVFRHPQIVVASILKEISIMPYLENFALSVRQAFELWRLMYSHVLRHHALTGDWLFVEYNDLFQPPVLDRLADFSQAAIDRTFPVQDLARSKGISAADPAAFELYNELIVHSKATFGR
jgi:Sulfotransferase family